MSRSPRGNGRLGSRRRVNIDRSTRWPRFPLLGRDESGGEGPTRGPYFDERYPDGSLRDVRLDLVTQLGDELVRDDEDEDLCSFHGLRDVWNSDLDIIIIINIRFDKTEHIKR